MNLLKIMLTSQKQELAKMVRIALPAEEKRAVCNTTIEENLPYFLMELKYYQKKQGISK